MNPSFCKWAPCEIVSLPMSGVRFLLSQMSTMGREFQFNGSCRPLLAMRLNAAQRGVRLLGISGVARRPEPP